MAGFLDHMHNEASVHDERGVGILRKRLFAQYKSLKPWNVECGDRRGTRRGSNHGKNHGECVHGVLFRVCPVQSLGVVGEKSTGIFILDT